MRAVKGDPLGLYMLLFYDLLKGVILGLEVLDFEFFKLLELWFLIWACGPWHETFRISGRGPGHTLA